MAATLRERPGRAAVRQTRRRSPGVRNDRESFQKHRGGALILLMLPGLAYFLVFTTAPCSATSSPSRTTCPSTDSGAAPGSASATSSGCSATPSSGTRSSTPSGSPYSSSSSPFPYRCPRHPHRAGRQHPCHRTCPGAQRLRRALRHPSGHRPAPRRHPVAGHPGRPDRGSGRPRGPVRPAHRHPGDTDGRRRGGDLLPGRDRIARDTPTLKGTGARDGGGAGCSSSR